MQHALVRNPNDSHTERAEKHSLMYMYTAFSKPVELPGIHEFTAMGLMDDRMIDYYDSDLKKKIPKEPWMEEKLPADYWENGTQSRLSKQQWFKVNIDILKQRMNQTDDDVHILQWMHGCEGETRPDGSVMFSRGVDMYVYDGRDFLSFNDTKAVWVAPSKTAVPTKIKWDDEQGLTEYTKGYLENDCIEWLNKFLPYGQKQLQAASPPDVYMFATNAKIETIVMLTCLATGFYPKDIKLEIKRDGRVLTKEDGLLTSGVRPNEDDTYQRRDSVEILRSDVASYRCEVRHSATGVSVEKIWDGKLPDPPGGNSVVIIAVVVVGVLVMAAVLLVFLYKKGIIGSKSPPSSRSSSPGASYTAVPIPVSVTTLPATTINVQGSDWSLNSGDSGRSSDRGATRSDWSLNSGDSDSGLSIACDNGSADTFNEGLLPPSEV
ncbi:H-2 class I histocompatibility antigen, Q10 alpha chain-like isoform X3 [Thunnus maccoyii]|uniref:H-2 class I histocompatibility antigen, Q10 alpha chain-like isoform X3 n=1 Tax=Thunnus maccoyii TaxID=8240 RepID=UPI001C4BDA7B|nr:H-2 class I histocompatibility antigen, Q10 alpha chain-like isoform X3 [Thunnus maccoyii]